MLKQVNRLKKRYQFNYVYKAGEHYFGAYSILYVTPSKTKNIKIGFSVTKKIGHAIVRNKIRRRLREIVQKHLPNLKQNYNIILVSKDNICDANFEELDKEIFRLFQKANLINDEKDI